MSLVNCKECGKEVSDQANTCPHCGVAFPAMPDEEVEAIISEQMQNSPLTILAKTILWIFALPAYIMGIIAAMVYFNDKEYFYLFSAAAFFIAGLVLTPQFQTYVHEENADQGRKQTNPTFFLIAYLVCLFVGGWFFVYQANEDKQTKQTEQTSQINQTNQAEQTNQTIEQKQNAWAPGNFDKFKNVDIVGENAYPSPAGKIKAKFIVVSKEKMNSYQERVDTVAFAALWIKEQLEKINPDAKVYELLIWLDDKKKDGSRLAIADYYPKFKTAYGDKAPYILKVEAVQTGTILHEAFTWAFEGKSTVCDEPEIEDEEAIKKMTIEELTAAIKADKDKPPRCKQVK